MKKEPQFVVCSECGKHGRIESGRPENRANGPEVCCKDEAILVLQISITGGFFNLQEIAHLLCEIQASPLPKHISGAEHKVIVLAEAWNIFRQMLAAEGEPDADPLQMHMLARKEKPEWN